MTAQTIRLNSSQWTFSVASPIGEEGGFGEVFLGEGSHGAVAVKRLRMSADTAAHRELTIGAKLAERSLSHVVPVLDYGQDAETGRYFLVMPLCGESLQAAVKRDGPMDYAAARPVILEIIAGLEEVGDLVHRDLKPSNILRHDGRWKVADFGIAKFIEDATSLLSLRNSLTLGYGAPEQWKGERPSPATDVYALGCIFYFLLTGAPPFVGEVEDVREQHLSDVPPPLPGVPSRISGLVATMLRKAGAVRPSLQRCKTVIHGETGDSPASARVALSSAAQQVAGEEAVREARETYVQQRRDERQHIYVEAKAELEANLGRLFGEIEQFSEQAQRRTDAVLLGKGHIRLDGLRQINQRIVDKPTHPESGWDAIAGGAISVEQSSPPYTWSVTVLFGKRPGDDEYRWYEMGFWSLGRKPTYEPTSLSPDGRDVDVALSNIVGVYNLAVGPTPIDAEDEAAFHERYCVLLARAATGQLQRPSQMPVPLSYFQ